MSDVPPERRAALEQAGRRLAAADDERRAALEQLRDAVRVAHGTMPVKTIAELGGVTRVTVYRMLED